ncbi:unannotated protein [freshwater metagenome]|uniref:Unannotated protein n=1 Tax=freshwater metagenome TaxID=449393 RepID=A0A6J6NMU3_9ZZZZ
MGFCVHHEILYESPAVNPRIAKVPFELEQPDEIHCIVSDFWAEKHTFDSGRDAPLVTVPLIDGALATAMSPKLISEVAAKAVIPSGPL